MKAKTRRWLRVRSLAAAVIVAAILGWQAWKANELLAIRRQIENADTFIYDESYFDHTPSAQQFEYRRGDPRFNEIRDRLIGALSHGSWLATWGGEGAGLLHCRANGNDTLDIEIWWYAIVVKGWGCDVPDDSVRRLLSGGE